MKRLLFYIIFFSIIGAVCYKYQTPLQVGLKKVENEYFPCRRALSYRIGSFDGKFGISRDDFLQALREAEEVWEKPTGKNLFTYDPTGFIAINLEYDKRQETSDKLKDIDKKMGDSKTQFTTLKSRYDSLQSRYESDRKKFELANMEYTVLNGLYEKKLSESRIGSGFAGQAASDLNAQAEMINMKVNALRNMQAKLNRQVKKINELAQQIKGIAESHNEGILEFTSVSGVIGEEFEQGNFKTGPEGQSINIYEFTDHKKLVRLLAHEMGHALWLDHVDDKDAIMHELNSSESLTLTTSDKEAIQTKCEGAKLPF